MESYRRRGEWAKDEARLEGVKVNDDESRLKKTFKRKKVVEKEFLFFIINNFFLTIYDSTANRKHCNGRGRDY